MTQPQQASVNATVQLVPTADGKVGVMLVTTTGLGQFMLLLPADQADGFIDSVAAEVKAKSAEARRANAGLLIAPADALQRLGNGHLFRPPGPPGTS